MQRIVTGLVVIAVAMAAVVGVQAQNEEAPAPSPSNTTLYAHVWVENNEGWINTLVEDGDAGETIMLFPDAEEDLVATSAGPVAQEDFLVELPLAPGLMEGLTLDAGGSIEVSARIGGGAATVGHISVGTRIMSGDVAIATGEAVVKPVYPAQANEELYIEFAWSLGVDAAEIPADQGLSWILEGSATAGNNFFLSTHEGRGISFITLPITGTLVDAASQAPGDFAGDVDADADGLNDTWEQEHFGNMSANATDDPDADGCDNACEFAAGTDPNVADTDGDGVNDGDEIAAGSDPLEAPESEGNSTAPADNSTAQPESPDGESAEPEDAAPSEEAPVDATDQESPGIGLVALLVALGAVAVRRRP